MGRFLERIAYHGVNIGENATYIVTAEFPGDTHLALRDKGQRHFPHGEPPEPNPLTER
jgi:phosphate uptake regulator